MGRSDSIVVYSIFRIYSLNRKYLVLDYSFGHAEEIFLGFVLHSFVFSLTELVVSSVILNINHFYVNLCFRFIFSYFFM